MRPYTLVVIVALLGLSRVQAQPPVTKPTTGLQAGPMLGHVAHREANIWFLLHQPAPVRLVFWPVNQPRLTGEVLPQSPDGRSYKAVLPDLSPGTAYGYRLEVGEGKNTLQYPGKGKEYRFETPADWLFRTDPPNLTVAVGSCSFFNDSTADRPGKPYGGEYEIFERMADSAPDVTLWLGDNVYFQPSDHSSRSGLHYRYRHSRSHPQLQRLLQTGAHYAIWDDHDYGPNDADRSYVLKQEALEAFQTYWANPSYGLPDQPGIFTTFSVADAQFFLLDGRWNRSSNYRTTDPQRQLLGPGQLQWLLDALKFSRANFKFVAIGGQVLNPVQRYETYANLAPAEREQLLQAINHERIEGVVFLNGDRHHTELTKLPRPEAYPLYDLTCSPLTSSSHDARDEPNTLREPDTFVGKRNFGLLKLEGPANARQLRIQIVDSQGQMQWERVILASELKYARNLPAGK